MKAAASVPVPPKAVVTETATVPAVPEGSFTMSLVELFDVIEVTNLVPNLTEVTVVKLVPVTVTVVPPAAGPVDGVTLVMVGAVT